MCLLEQCIVLFGGERIRPSGRAQGKIDLRDIRAKEERHRPIQRDAEAALPPGHLKQIVGPAEPPGREAGEPHAQHLGNRPRVPQSDHRAQRAEHEWKAGSEAVAALIATQMLGLAYCRYILRLSPLLAMSREGIVRSIGANVQRYLGLSPSSLEN
jgi:hypothetical protein